MPTTSVAMSGDASNIGRCLQHGGDLPTRRRAEQYRATVARPTERHPFVTDSSGRILVSTPPFRFLLAHSLPIGNSAGNFGKVCQSSFAISHAFPLFQPIFQPNSLWWLAGNYFPIRGAKRGQSSRAGPLRAGAAELGLRWRRR